MMLHNGVNSCRFLLYILIITVNGNFQYAEKTFASVYMQLYTSWYEACIDFNVCYILPV